MNLNLIRDPCLSWSCNTTDWLPWVTLARGLGCQRTQVISNIQNIIKLIEGMEDPAYSNVIEHLSDVLCNQPKPAWRWLYILMLFTAGRCTDIFCKHKHALWLTFIFLQIVSPCWSFSVRFCITFHTEFTQKPVRFPMSSSEGSALSLLIKSIISESRSDKISLSLEPCR